MVQEYLNKLFKKYQTGDASERSYYPVLENLLNEFPKDSKKYSVLVESRKSSVGIPDFKVETSKNLLIGYIEAKDLGRDLDRLSKKEQEQIEKYLKEYPKLIVTNFIEFRLYENGEKVDSVLISQPITLRLKQSVLTNEPKFKALLERFYSTIIPKVYSSKQLAELLAHKTHVLRDLVREEINLEDDEVTPTEELLDAFKKTLRPDISEDDFADMYAQTVTYGLFSARLNAGEKHFNRVTAYDYIPQTIPLLRKIFFLISGQNIQQHIKWQADEIAEILANTDIDKIQSEFFKQGKGRDPIIHFYETFLSEYDPKERARRGVYYTPEAVVSYITKSIHKLLKYKFMKKDGFADNSVTVLDPAAGTLTFLANAIYLAKDELVSRYGSGTWNSLVKEHILKDFYAFEILMAPYTVGHLKISLLLKESGYEMQEDDRFKLYLTNTLNFKKVENLPLLMLIKEITDESKNAFNVKTKQPVLVITGNPPYSVSSSNIIEKGSDFYNLYESYKELVRIQEKNIQPLSDDYIKFIAFAHWKVKQAGQGIVGMITNNSYLDGLIHRDMRKKLLEDFNEIYILNLHGSVKRKDMTPGGKKDENVFDIQQGVSIVLLVKNGNANKVVKYADLLGLREEKYSFLEKNDVYTNNWIDLSPKFPNNFFVPKDFSGNENYEKFVSLKNIFSSTGVKTHRDKFALAESKEELKKRLEIFTNADLTEDMLASTFNIKNTNSWNISDARRKLNAAQIEDNLFRTYSYRPFDTRYIYYSNILVDRTRDRSIWNINEENLGLAVTRQLSSLPFKHAFVTSSVPDICLLSLQTKESAYIFPLYNYYETGQQNLLTKQGRSINFNWGNLGWLEVLQPFTSNLSGNFIQVEQAIFYYIYAILYSNTYREKYQEFLKIDFPRIPFTKDYELFKALAQRGEQLANLHLLKSEELSNPIIKFQGKDDIVIEKIEYVGVLQDKLRHADEVRKTGLKLQRSGGFVYINEGQYFFEMPDEVWNYYIGGYQVAHKWLKDRKGRALMSEDIKHYCRVVTALSKTIEVQREIDRLYSKAEESL